MSFRRSRKRSEGIFYVGQRTTTRQNLLLGKIPRLAALPRNDISVGDSIQPHRFYPQRIWRQIAAATPASYNGKPNVAAMIHRQASFRIQPVWVNGTTPRHVIPTEMKWSGGIYPSSKLYLTQFILATWEDSSTSLRSGRNDIRFSGRLPLPPAGPWILTRCFPAESITPPSQTINMQNVPGE